MAQIVLKTENLSKQYRLGLVGTGTLSHDLNRWWHKIRGKEDPYLKIGEANDRSKKGDSEYVWALKDINFEVKKGEVFGVIGRNGAGKSTLLKILSKVTGPTTGTIKAKGRIASLLEVGTGFHPELTGKENIFLNGAILGMTRKEINSKLDEIISFAGIDRYADTPVKRYSSGMYVRLAFAVAAHLEPEILIVDEVLAVGDADFQKKAIGKMKSISQGEGRTVIFVSHDMAAINSLCNRTVLLKNGTVELIGETKKIVNQYLYESRKESTFIKWNKENRKGDKYVKLNSLQFVNALGNNIPTAPLEEKFGLNIQFEILESIQNLEFGIMVHDLNETCAFANRSSTIEYIEEGNYQITVWIPPEFLNSMEYYFSVGLSSTYLTEKIHLYLEKIIGISCIENRNLRNINFRGDMPGIIKPKLDWTLSTTN